MRGHVNQITHRNLKDRYYHDLFGVALGAWIFGIIFGLVIGGMFK